MPRANRTPGDPKHTRHQRRASKPTSFGLRRRNETPHSFVEVRPEQLESMADRLFTIHCPLWV
jgi:hypothetical protein